MSNPAAPPVSILIADDQLGVAQAYQRALSPRFHVAGIVTTLAGIPGKLRTLEPDTALMDVSFGHKSSIGLLPRLHKTHSAVRFIMLTAYLHPALVEAAFLAGARGYVGKLADLDELAIAIEEVHRGGTFISPQVYSLSYEHVGVRDSLVPAHPMTPTQRQLQILVLLRFGYHIPYVAQRLGIAVKTVDEHIHEVRDLTGIPDRARIIQWAEQFMPHPIEGWNPPPLGSLSPEDP